MTFWTILAKYDDKWELAYEVLFYTRQEAREALKEFKDDLPGVLLKVVKVVAEV